MRRPRLERLQESLYRRSIGGIRDLKDGRFKVVSAATTCDQQWPKQPNMEFLGLEPWVRCCTLTKSCGPVDRSEVDSLAPSNRIVLYTQAFPLPCWIARPSQWMLHVLNPPALGRRRVLPMWLVCLSYVESICNKKSVSGASFCLV